MEKPPTPLRKVESSSTSSLSSLDPNNAIPLDPQSHRLVDYFVVFSSQARLKNKRKKKPPKHDEDSDKFDDHDATLQGQGNGVNNTNGNTNGDAPKTPKRYCCKKKKLKRKKKKKSSKKNPANTNTNTNTNTNLKAEDESSTVSSKRISSRAIHLSENNIVDSHSVTGSISITDPMNTMAIVEDITPVVTHSRKTVVSPNRNRNRNRSSRDGNGHDHDEQLLLSDKQLQSEAAAATVGMAKNNFRVPVTSGSFNIDSSDSSLDDGDGDDQTTVRRGRSRGKGNDNGSDNGYDNGNGNDNGHTVSVSLATDTTNHTYTKTGDKEEEEEEEVLTPSRMRAKQGFHSDEEEEDIAKHHTNQSKSKSKKAAAVKNRPHTAASRGTEGGASENIHLPETNQTNANGGGSGGGDPSSKSNVYLVPVETARYPLQDHADNAFNPMISHFCFPQGLQMQFTTDYIMPRIHYFVLTNDRGKKMYGCCLTVYEEFDVANSTDIDEEDLEPFFRNDDVIVESVDSEDSIEVSLEYVDKCPPLYHPKVLCILSSWPYLNAFREYLSQLYRLATMTNMMTCPIERYVLNICEEVPAPPPGMFEIRLQILNSTIRFWAPPAKQPIPYVSIPFNVLFECLDLNNVLFVWYALTLEHKILLVSSQNSLLTLCAEILVSLLFPMEWSHLYIPILPLFLSQMLDAPFPYLCGISRDNLTHAVGDISEETIVVDLDQNVITKGDNTPPFPPMPLKRRSKLEACLKRNVGEIFWAARGVTKEEVQAFEEKGPSSSTRSANDMMKTLRIWKERLISYDDAFNLAYTPDSENLMNSGKGLFGVEDEFGQTKWDCVQEGFLTFFVSMLRDYKRFISKNAKKRTFREKEFINAQRPDFKPFLKAFCLTQHFDCFLTKRMYNPKEPDVLFFDQSITAKRNRSIKTLKKKRTPFLQSAKAQKQLRTVDAATPSLESETNFNLLDRIYANASEKKSFSYTTWPETFDPKLLQNPRKIPDVIAAEFNRLSGQRRPNQPDNEFNDFHVTDVINSVEVTVFTLFFILCCELVGKELEGIQKQYLPRSERMLTENGISKSVFSDCSSVCTLGKSVTSVTINEEYSASYKSNAMDNMKSDMGLGDFPVVDELKNSEIEAARVFAFAELDLTFSVLETLFQRKLKPNVDALKPLMAACGRCGSSDRATKLMNMILDHGIHIDSETYFYFLMNAPLDDFDKSQRRRKLPSSSNWSAMKKKAHKRKKPEKKKKKDDGSLDGSEHSYFSGPSSSFQDTVSLSSSTVGYSHFPPRPQTPLKRRKPLTRKEDLNTTDQVDKHINIGESLISYLYSDLKIETNKATCRSCGETVREDQVRFGWKCSFTDYTTECPHCRNNFVPSFVVKTSDPKFIGSQGPGTPLHCEFLSPWVLHKEVHIATQGVSSAESILDPQWRNGGDRNTILWWNLIVTFQRHKLPITFLLQGSFRERLIMPMPDS